MGMVLAPALLPAQAAGPVGVEPGTDEFRDRYGRLLRGTVRRLAVNPPGGPAGTPPPAE